MYRIARIVDPEINRFTVTSRKVLFLVTTSVVKVR